MLRLPGQRPGNDPLPAGSGRYGAFTVLVRRRRVLLSKLTEAEAKAKIMLSKETSVADWERIMAQGSQSSWKDEWFVIVLSIPLVLAFIPGTEGWVDKGFAQLSKAPDWYFYSLGIAISASFGVRGVQKFFKR